MKESIEKVYCFSKKELLLLFGLGGLKEVYSFEFPDREDFTQEDLIYSLYDLVKDGQLEVQDQVVLSEKMEKILRKIDSARMILTILPKKNGNQKICYFADDSVLITELSSQNEEIRIVQNSYSEFWKRLFDGVETFFPTLATEEEGAYIETYNHLIKEEHEKIQADSAISMDQPLLSCLEIERILCVWEMVDFQVREVICRIFFFKGILNDWICLQSKTERRTYFNSEESHSEIEKWILERVKKGGENRDYG